MATASGAGTALPAQPDPSLPAPIAVHIRGRVVDLAGRPVGAIPWRARSRSTGATGISGADGSIDVELSIQAEEAVVLTAEGLGQVAVRNALVRLESRDADPIVVVMPAVALAGRVLDAGDRPLAGARLAVVVDGSAFARCPLPLENSLAETWTTAAAADGSFAFAAVPTGSGVRLIASLAGYAEHERAVPGAPDQALRIVLEPLPAPDLAGGGAVRGVVLDATGAPVAGASVFLAQRESLSDDRGEFALPVVGVPDDALLIAVKAGLQPAALRGSDRGGWVRVALAGAVSIVLAGPALAISGRVLAAGVPQFGWQVSLVDPLCLDPWQEPRRTAEDAARGDSDPVITGGDGTFAIGGLAARDYTLRAVHRSTLASMDFPAVPAGARGVDLEVGKIERRAPLAGTVVGRDGRPIAGVRVGACLALARDGGARSAVPGPAATTGADGRFALPSLPLAGVFLRFGGAAVVAEERDLGAFGDASDVVVVLQRLCRFRVECGSHVEELEIRDRAGAALTLRQADAATSGGTTRIALVAGAAPVLTVGDDAVEVAFFAGGELLRTVPLQLAPDSITVVRE